MMMMTMMNALFTRNKVGCSTKDITTYNNYSDRKVPQKQLK